MGLIKDSKGFHGNAGCLAISQKAVILSFPERIVSREYDKISPPFFENRFSFRTDFWRVT